MAEALEVQLRDQLGTRNTRRLRRDGRVPAILYGHGQPNVCLTLCGEQLQTAVRHGSRVVELGGAVTERAFVRDLQWDVFGQEVLHVDLARISEHEKVEVDVVVELRGEAPGVRAGGVIQHLIHEISLECEVTAIPDRIHVNVNHLELGGSIKVCDLSIPGATIMGLEGDDIVVQCVEPAAEEEETAADAAAEPEVIGRKKEEEGEGDE